MNSVFNQKIAVEWLSQLLTPFLNDHQFKPDSALKKYTKETKQFKQQICIDFANYKNIAYSPTITVKYTDKKLEKSFSDYWKSLDFNYKTGNTFWCQVCKPKNGMGQFDELCYEHLPSIENAEDAFRVAHLFQTFYNNELSASLKSFENPANYIRHVIFHDYWSGLAVKSKEKFWFWTNKQDGADIYKRYFYLHTYHPNLISEQRMIFFDSIKANGHELAIDFINQHDERIDKMKNYL